MPLYRKRYPVVTLGMPPEGFAGVAQPVMGNTFFVDPVNGSDAKRGTDINHPLLTLEQAVENAVDGQGDIINCFPGTHNIESTDGLVLEKEGLVIQAMEYGMNRHGGGMGENFTIRNLAGITDVPAITIKQPCKIIGMGITTRNTSGPSLLFDCEETGGFNGGFSHILNCRFSAWYGAIDSFIYMIGGQFNRIEGCAFDGLSSGITTAGILLDSDTGPIDVGFTQIIGNYFYGMGPSKPAIKVASSDTATGLVVAHNYLSAGFVSANQGVLIDLNNTDSFGLIADNWVAPLANQAAAMLNTGSWTGGFADNHYEET